MSQLETQLMQLLRQVVVAAERIGQIAYRPWCEIWGPPLISMLITAIGWWVVVGLNQKNNRDLLALQTKELARNRILDALDEYVLFLRDIEYPRIVTMRAGAEKHQAPVALMVGVSTQSEDVIDCAAVRSIIASLTLFDSRASRWIGVLRRESWVWAGDPDTSKIMERLESIHDAITSDQIDYYQELATKADEGEAAVRTFLESGRSAGATRNIDKQQEQIRVIYAALNTPAFLRNVGATNKKLSS